MQKRRRVRVSAGDPPPEAYRALRSWLRFRWGNRGDFDRYLMQSAMRRQQAAAGVRRRSPTIAKRVAVGLIFVLAAVAAAALAIWSWRG